MSPRLPEFLAQVFPEVKFAITPYLPFGGITLLYGKTTLGKSPLTWEMGRCVASGESFLGHYPTARGHIHYFDLDTPPALVQKRLLLMEAPPDDFWIDFPGVRNILQTPAQDYFKRKRDESEPIMVVMNTLRKLYPGDEKDASLPSRVYSILLSIFSPASITLVHHDKKSAGDPDDQSDPDEAFSGHMAWLNDCQVGLHLIRAGGHTPGLMRLVQSKSQVSAQEPPRTLQLSKDGTALVDYKGAQASAVIKLYHELPVEMGKTDKVSVISQTLRCGTRMVWTYLSYLPEPEQLSTAE